MKREFSDSNHAITEYFDRHALRYDEIIGNLAFQLDDGYQYFAEYIRTATSHIEDLRVLELGIGTGKLTEHILRGHARSTVVGIDTSPRMLEKATTNLAGYRDRVTLLCGDFSDNRLFDQKFDVVISAIALTFYTINHAALYRTVNHLLKKDGLFVYAANVAQNVSIVESAVGRMLVGHLGISKEQAQWLKDIKGSADTDIFLAPWRWHLAELRNAGFYNVDCIYLRYKLGLFSGQKPGSAV
jgi:tRNA (cmo5U34)-methyltransferase